jgi:hypothetical protein
MDFTYLVALVLSVIIGFAGALMFIAMRGQSYRRFAISVVFVIVAADFALLVDWSRANEFTASFLLTDAAFFVGYGIVGGLIGALPVLGLRAAYRRLTTRRVG